MVLLVVGLIFLGKSFAIALPAFSSALFFNMGASSGGTDVIAALFKKYTSVNIGRALLYTDILFAAASFIIFDVKPDFIPF